MFTSALRHARASQHLVSRLHFNIATMFASTTTLNSQGKCSFFSENTIKNKKRPRDFAPVRESSSSRSLSEDFKLDLFVSCLPGLEDVLSEELKSLKLPHSRTMGGANIRDASVEQLFQCHLYLGTASHVLLRCGKPFRARKFAELRRKVAKMPWSKWLKNDSYITDIRVSASKSKLYHTGAIAERIQKAIDESLGREAQEPNVKMVAVDKAVQLTVRIIKDMVQLSIDTSASPLHQRGYRLQTAKAPLREDIAFAMLHSSGWRPIYEGGDDAEFKYGGLLDPFCGSGTILIEAASIVAGLPPGRLRPAPLGGTHFFDPTRWKSLVEDPVTRPFRSYSEVIILGSDRDDGAVAAAASNANRAGIGDQIDVVKAAIASSPWLENPSIAPEAPLILTNPPFGHRIKGKGDSGTLLPLYQKLGYLVTHLLEARVSELMEPGATATILAHDVSLARRTGLPLQTLFATHHGGIEVSAMSTLTKEARTER